MHACIYREGGREENNEPPTKSCESHFLIISQQPSSKISLDANIRTYVRIVRIATPIGLFQSQVTLHQHTHTEDRALVVLID